MPGVIPNDKLTLIHIWEELFPVFGSVAQSTQGVTLRPRSSCDLRERAIFVLGSNGFKRIVFASPSGQEKAPGNYLYDMLAQIVAVEIV